MYIGCMCVHWLYVCTLAMCWFIRYVCLLVSVERENEEVVEAEEARQGKAGSSDGDTATSGVF